MQGVQVTCYIALLEDLADDPWAEKVRAATDRSCKVVGEAGAPPCLVIGSLDLNRGMPTSPTVAKSSRGWAHHRWLEGSPHSLFAAIVSFAPHRVGECVCVGEGFGLGGAYKKYLLQGPVVTQDGLFGNDSWGWCKLR